MTDKDIENYTRLYRYCTKCRCTNTDIYKRKLKELQRLTTLMLCKGLKK